MLPVSLLDFLLAIVSSAQIMEEEIWEPLMETYKTHFSQMISL